MVVWLPAVTPRQHSKCRARAPGHRPRGIAPDAMDSEARGWALGFDCLTDSAHHFERGYRAPSRTPKPRKRTRMVAALLLASLLAAGDALGRSTSHAGAGHRACRAGKHQAALEAFQQLAAENPRNPEPRLWIGRMHAEMGHHGWRTGLPKRDARAPRQPRRGHRSQRCSCRPAPQRQALVCLTRPPRRSHRTLKLLRPCNRRAAVGSCSSRNLRPSSRFSHIPRTPSAGHSAIVSSRNDLRSCFPGDSAGLTFAQARADQPGFAHLPPAASAPCASGSCF